MSRSIPIQKIRSVTFPDPPVIAERGDGIDPDIIRMNLNEAPFPPSPRALEAASSAMDYVNFYPDHGCTHLSELISERTGIPVDRVSFGNGSGEILVALAMMSLNEGDHAVMPAPTFPTCGKGVQIAGGEIINVPLREDGVNDVPAMLDALTSNTKLFYLCTPNNPTGGILSEEELALAARNIPDDCLLVVDEAYYEFAEAECGIDVLEILADRTGPWAVTRSFSKAYCLAGMRVGYALTSDPETCLGIRLLRPNFNITRVSQAAAHAAMEDQPYLEQTLTTTISERRRLASALEKLGFGILPSYANFICVCPPINAKHIAGQLTQHNILVQELSWPDETGSLRITIGNVSDNDSLINAVRKIAS